MAMSKPTNFDDSRILTCELCSEIYKSPKILSCLHSFCEECIGNFINSLTRSKEDGKIKDFNCPLCRTRIQPSDPSSDSSMWAASLHRNVILEMMILKENGSVIHCHTCERFDEKSQASIWCPICQESMCDKCHTMHLRMKLSMDHGNAVVPIDELGMVTRGLDIQAISEDCRVHSSKKIDHFCSNHKKVCCSFCLSSSHRTCELRPIVDILENESGSYDSLRDNLQALREAIKQVHKQKEKEKVKLKSLVDGTEVEAAKLIDVVKCKINSLFETFKKELNVFYEEERAKINVKMRLLDQLITAIDHWVVATDIVKRNAPSMQLFVLVESVKEQVEARIREISSSIENDNVVGLWFEKNKLLIELEHLDNIGSFQLKREFYDLDPLDGVYKCCQNTGVKMFPSYTKLGLEKIRSIRINKSSLSCGAWVDKHHIIVGDATQIHMKCRLYLMDIETESVIDTCTFGGQVKRLCYVQEKNQLFIACYNSELYRTEIKERKISQPTKLTFNTDIVEDLVYYDNNIYVIVNGAIKYFKVDAISASDPNVMIECFKTNTGISSSYWITLHNGKLLYTTKDDEVKRTDFDGKEVFCYKSSSIGGLVNLPSGASLVLKTLCKGSLDLLSADGKRHRTLLEGFEKLLYPSDIWLNEDGRIVYICGDDSIEIYEVKWL